MDAYQQFLLAVIMKCKLYTILHFGKYNSQLDKEASKKFSIDPVGIC